jgi:hypothetical protein
MAVSQGFTDSKGRKWLFTCDTFTLHRLKKTTGIDLTKAIEQGEIVTHKDGRPKLDANAEPLRLPNPNGIEEIVGDVEKFFDVVLSLLEDDIKEAGIDLREFGRGIDDEDIVLAASKALVEAVLSFFPPDRSAAMKRAFQKLWDATTSKVRAQNEKAIAEIDAIDFDKMAEEVIGEMETKRNGKTTTTKKTTETNSSPAASGA